MLYIKYISIKTFYQYKPFKRAYYMLDALNTLIHVHISSIREIVFYRLRLIVTQFPNIRAELCKTSKPRSGLPN